MFGFIKDNLFKANKESPVVFHAPPAIVSPGAEVPVVPNLFGRALVPFSIEDLKAAFKYQFGGYEIKQATIVGEGKCVGYVPPEVLAAVCAKPLSVGKAVINWEQYKTPVKKPNLFGHCAGDAPKVAELVFAFKKTFNGLNLEHPSVWVNAGKAYCSGHVLPDFLTVVLAKKTIVGNTTVSWGEFKSTKPPHPLFVQPDVLPKVEGKLDPKPVPKIVPRSQKEHVLCMFTDLELKPEEVRQTLAKKLDIDVGLLPPFEFRLTRSKDAKYEARVVLPSAELLAKAVTFHFNMKLVSKAKERRTVDDEKHNKPRPNKADEHNTTAGNNTTGDHNTTRDKVLQGDSVIQGDEVLQGKKQRGNKKLKDDKVVDSNNAKGNNNMSQVPKEADKGGNTTGGNTTGGNTTGGNGPKADGVRKNKKTDDKLKDDKAKHKNDKAKDNELKDNPNEKSAKEHSVDSAREEHVLRLTSNLDLNAEKVHQTLAKFLCVRANSFRPFRFQQTGKKWQAFVYLPSAELLDLAVTRKFHFHNQLISEAKPDKWSGGGFKPPKVREIDMKENMTTEVESDVLLKCFLRQCRSYPELEKVKCKLLPYSNEPSLNVSGQDLPTVQKAIVFAQSVISNYKQAKCKIDPSLRDLLCCFPLRVAGVEYELPRRDFKTEEREEKDDKEEKDEKDEEGAGPGAEDDDEASGVGPEDIVSEKREVKETVEVSVCAISEASLQDFISQLSSFNVVTREIPLSNAQHHSFVRFASVDATTSGPVYLTNLPKDAKKADLARELSNVLKCEVTQAMLQLNTQKKPPSLTISGLAPSGRTRLLAKGFFLTKQGTMKVKKQNSIITSHLEKEFIVSVKSEKNRVTIIGFDQSSVDNTVFAIKDSLRHAKKTWTLSKYHAAFAETDQAKAIVKTLAKQFDVAIEFQPTPLASYVISGSFITNVLPACAELERQFAQIAHSSLYDLTHVSNKSSIIKWLLRKNVGTAWNSEQTLLELVAVDENSLKSISKELSEQITKMSAPIQQQQQQQGTKLPKISESELKIEEMIGEGGSATVYKGTWMRPASAQRAAHIEKVAIKVFKSTSEASRELEVMSDLPHPNILQIFGVCETVPLKIVCEFMADDLDSLIKAKRVTIQKGLRFLRDVAAGMAHLHRYHVAHRDLKPRNILITGGQAKVSDFGSSKDINQTIQNTTVGTFLFIAPEVNMGQPSGLSADVYSFGVTMYQVLSGALPNPRARTAELVQDLRKLAIPDRIVDLFSQCNADIPTDRPSMEQLREALEVIVEINDQDNENLDKQLNLACNEDLKEYNKIWQESYESQDGTNTVLERVGQISSQIFPPVYQVYRDQNSLEAAAISVNDQIHAILRSVVEGNGGKYSSGPLKTAERLCAKVHADYQGDFSRILDVVRGTGLFEKSRGFLVCLESLGTNNEVEIVRVKDRLNNPEKFGYRDVLFNVRHRKTQFVAELLLTFTGIFNYKSQSHRIYSLSRVRRGY